MVFVWLILGLVAFSVVVDVCFRRYSTRRIQGIFENVPPFGIVPIDVNPAAQRLHIPVQDGQFLAGSLHRRAGKPCQGLIIFCPELNGNHGMAPQYCQALIDAGFAVLGFDFRNQGESFRQPDYSPIHWITEFEMSDIAAVLEFIESDHELSTLPLGIFGVSRGGAAALAAACRYPRISTVVADSSFGTMSMTRNFVCRFVRLVIPEWIYKLLPEWHIKLTLRQAMRRSEADRKCQYVHLEQEAQQLDDTRVLLIAGARDSYVTVDVSTELANDFGGQDRLWMVERAKHNMARTQDQAQYDQRITAHFAPMAVDADVPADSELAAEVAR